MWQNSPWRTSLLSPVGRMEKKRENIDLKELYQLYNEIDSYISQRYNELFGL
ncbi:hypothetical protein M075_0946 [Bacteroides fragilis str. 20793-3]|nr:hypothetical protein M075_0946 [Bacteroides fragilis str. 20793-3]